MRTSWQAVVLLCGLLSSADAAGQARGGEGGRLVPVPGPSLRPLPSRPAPQEMERRGAQGAVSAFLGSTPVTVTVSERAPRSLLRRIEALPNTRLRLELVPGANTPPPALLSRLEGLSAVELVLTWPVLKVHAEALEKVKARQRWRVRVAPGVVVTARAAAPLMGTRAAAITIVFQAWPGAPALDALAAAAPHLHFEAPLPGPGEQLPSQATLRRLSWRVEGPAQAWRARAAEARGQGLVWDPGVALEEGWWRPLEGGDQALTVELSRRALLPDLRGISSLPRAQLVFTSQGSPRLPRRLLRHLEAGRGDLVESGR